MKQAKGRAFDWLAVSKYRGKVALGRLKVTNSTIPVKYAAYCAAAGGGGRFSVIRLTSALVMIAMRSVQTADNFPYSMSYV
jgi:hypothetical protein